ncbi:MAG: metalloregulator ArsR/SmtB family transcription factor [Eubacteriales bacterium]|nr:metalloregulator ArsR/SmtB family transcription factor [Eubacteriales bacterium]
MDTNANRHEHEHGVLELLAHLKEPVPSLQQFKKVSDIFKILGDPNRCRIFWILCHCETCVIDLSNRVEMTSPAVSHHLRQLRNMDLVISERIGKEVYYRAAETEITALLHQMIEKVIDLACPYAD